MTPTELSANFKISTVSEISCPKGTAEHVRLLLNQIENGSEDPSRDAVNVNARVVSSAVPSPIVEEAHTFRTNGTANYIVVPKVNDSPSASAAKSSPVENSHPESDHILMNTVSREEVEQRIRVAEANAKAALAEFREEATKLRSDLRAGNDQIGMVLKEVRSQGEKNEAESSKFYAKATEALARLELTGEKNRTAIMSMGYKVATWIFGAVIAIGTVSLAIYKAVSVGLAS